MARKKAYDTENTVFATKLRNLMSEFGTTQQELADALSVKRQTISLYTTGQSKPDVEQLAVIADYFNVSADWMLGLTGDRKRTPSTVDDLGLSERAVSNIAQYGLMIETLNRLLERVDFSAFIAQIALYLKHINKKGPSIEDLSSAELSAYRDILTSHGFQVSMPEERALVHYGRATEYLKKVLDEIAEEAVQNG